MRGKTDYTPGLLLIAILLFSIWFFLTLPADADERPPGSEKKYSVEAFSDELTIRIECGGVCDLAEMKAEAREAVRR